MKKIIKILSVPIFSTIRKIIKFAIVAKEVFKKNCLPEELINKTPPLNPYQDFYAYYQYIEDKKKSSYNHFRKYFNDAIFLNPEDTKIHAIKKATENDIENQLYYLEFGVWYGISANMLAKYLKTNLYGFDSFEGLKEDWPGYHHTKGSYSLQGKIPELASNVIPIKGWFQDTLAKFLNEKKPKINFVHMDCHNYESTKFVLKNIKPYLNKKSIITFHELHNVEGWDVCDYKALTETFNENEYKFIAFSKHTQATIQII
tara:strand:+ start:346 stop:1122 length:777 start_codon:yes stop_codon:yes gene_type:complete